MNGIGKWIWANFRTVLTIAVILISFIATATLLTYKVGANEAGIANNTACIDDLKSDVAEDIGDLKMDMREVKTILERIERKVDN